jgi:hypothetical protein
VVDQALQLANQVAGKKHTDRFERCIEQVMAQGHDKGSAFAICTASFQRAGEPIFEVEQKVENFRWPGETQALTGELKERFTWLRPLEYYRREGSGRLYFVRALPVGKSRNPPKYVMKEVERAARTLAGVPVTLNHESLERPGKNVVLDAEFEDDAAEAVAYVEDPEINRLYDEGKIQHASIEGNYRYVTPVDGIIPHGVFLTGLSFLTSDLQPGMEGTSVQLIEAFLEKFSAEDVHKQGELLETSASKIESAQAAPPQSAVSGAQAVSEQKLCPHMNPDGTFKGGFEGCVEHFTSGCAGEALPEENARRLCAYIGRRAGKM